MDVITIESESFRRLMDKIDLIVNHINSNQTQQEGNLDDVWVDSYEVCTFLRISERTLQRLRTNGVISYSVISGKTYYTIAEIKRTLKERLVKSGEECLDDLIKNHQKYLENRRNQK